MKELREFDEGKELLEFC